VGYGKIRMRFETASSFNIAAFNLGISDGPLIVGQRLQGPGGSYSFFNRYDRAAELVALYIRVSMSMQRHQR
jgi:predicted MFS family arabinose efflux permease